MTSISDVILTQVAVQPVAEVEEAVVHRQYDVSYQSCTQPCTSLSLNKTMLLPRPRVYIIQTRISSRLDHMHSPPPGEGVRVGGGYGYAFCQHAQAVFESD